MKLATFLAPGSTVPQAGEVRGADVVAFEQGTVLDRLASGDRTPAAGPVHRLESVVLLAPIPRPPAIFCIGRNYAAHIEELKSERPDKPLVFLKLPRSSAPPGGPVIRPAVTQALDYETELVLVMGPADEIAGYAVADDVSARDLQRSEKQWTRAKGFDTFCPLGPVIDTDLDVERATIETSVNGVRKQDGRLADMVHSIPALIAYASSVFTLLPGDVILTGTPAGVGPIVDGDTVEITVSGLGTLSNPVRAAG